ncbi:MAG: plastocyanin/azurin family copper-binding protein [Actinomycetota bacterium]|nr:plastocyanin/azurin family copper-binding protein [Actinomycetota bacterium]
MCGLLVSAVTLAVAPARPAAAADALVLAMDHSAECLNHCFVPELVTINVGESVTWQSQSHGEEHDITRCSFGPCPVGPGTGTGPFPEELLEPEEVFTFTFTEPGTYNYYCAIHGYNDMRGVITVAGETGPEKAPPADFDGDGDTDVSLFRPSSGYWFVNGGATTQFGTTGDIPVPGDYDGDGDTDVAVYRPSNGYWFVNGGAITQFGTSGDIPVPGDYDGNGTTDIAVFRPSNGYWFVNGGAITQFGTSGDVPLPLFPAIRATFFPSA